jgi:phosphotransferase system HPr-like phosphotransfer protein
LTIPSTNGILPRPAQRKLQEGAMGKFDSRCTLKMRRRKAQAKKKARAAALRAPKKVATETTKKAPAKKKPAASLE